MKVKKQLRIPAFSIPLWWPDLPGDWRVWMPSRGNVLFTLVMIAILLWAQSAGAVPFLAESAASTGTIAYQGRLADSAGNPLTSTLNMSFRLYAASTGGTPLWTEDWTGSNGVKVSDGLFNVMLGSLTPIPQSVITGNANLFLGITVGTDDEMTPRVQLGSVPFAVQALSVPDGSVTTAKITDGAVTAAKLDSSISFEPEFSFGGFYTVNPHTGSCQSDNPFTSSCSCPVGYSPQIVATIDHGELNYNCNGLQCYTNACYKASAP